MNNLTSINAFSVKSRFVVQRYNGWNITVSFGFNTLSKPLTFALEH